MTGIRFADVQGRPAEFLNLTSLTLEEFEVVPFEFQGRRGASMGNPEPLHRLSDLPAGNAGRSAVLSAHLPEDLRRPSGPGAAVRHEPEQSQPVVLLPALLAVLRGLGDAPARSLTAPAGCLGGGTRAAGGAFALPPFAHDGTERRIVRPQDPAEQTDCYSGKKKDHTVKNILLVNAPLIILFLSNTVGSMTSGLPRRHRIPYQAGADCCRISASWPSRSPRWRSSCRGRSHRARNCHRRSKEPTHSRRLRIEHVNSSVKRCRVVKAACGSRASVMS
jgi:hypothetical protein